MRAPVATVVVIAGLLAVGCAPRLFGLPAVEVSATSPDGRVTAFVRNHPSVDPPNQSLRLTLADGRDVEVSKLAPDQDWSNQIVWSADSRRTAFLVQDSRVALVEASSGRVLGWTMLVNDSSDYPTAEMVRDLALSQDGSEATYRICRRPSAVRGISEADAEASCGPVVSRALRAEDR